MNLVFSVNVVTFSGTNERAFPNGSYVDWRTDYDSAISQVTNCIETKQKFDELWYVLNRL